MKLSFSIALAIAAPMAPLLAQDATILYRLGKDTVAVETFSRTPTKMTGETVVRSGGAIVRTTYDITIANNRPTAVVFRRLQADGNPPANAPVEWRFTLGADSAKREIVWKDSTQRAAFAAANAIPAFPVYTYAPFELIYARGAGKRDSAPAIPLQGTTVGVIGLETVGGDTLKMRGGTYAMLVRFDREGRLLSTDGSFTTNKAVGTRSSGKANIASLAGAMKPTGVLSPRATAYAGFNRGPIFINYGRPAVRERTVWGGALIPYDSVWRTGANEATHLATSKPLSIGDLSLPAGLYTLWIQHTRNGTFLIVNKQVGQWGTDYSPAQDIGKVKMEMAKTPEHVEDFTITVRPTGPNRGAIDFAWGDSVATAAFTTR
jgi:hypothetical protein